jgi:acyl carrier protein
MQTQSNVNKMVIEAVKELLEDKLKIITNDSELIGGESLLDSMKLVELCLALEDKATEIGFEFDWTSDAAMSNSRSMFRTVASLTNEFIIQMGTKK